MVRRREGRRALRRSDRPCEENAMRSANADQGDARLRCSEPRFAVEAGLTALHWITAGHGYEITGADVLAASSSTMDAARNGGPVEEAQGRILALITGPRSTAKDLIAAVALPRQRSSPALVPALTSDARRDSDICCSAKI